MKNLFKSAMLYTSLTCILSCFNAHANEPYVNVRRIEYIASVLQAFNKTDSQSIYNTYRYINVVDKNNCRSSLSDLRVECLLSFANKNCTAIRSAEAKERCALFSDIIIVNKLSENSFIDKSERYRILKSSKHDHRIAITDRLQQKYARIVSEFSLTGGAVCEQDNFLCLARTLDRFCLNYTNTQSLSWQHCMSASLWFIGTAQNR